MSGAVTVDELVARTRARLGGRQRRVVPKGSLRQAAVLIPIVDRGEPWLVFAKRTERVAHHKGQISFPGGTLAPTDRSLEDAALRECKEEIGLAREAVEVLGVLDDTETVATEFVITPFVGLVREPPAWRPDGEEIEKVVEVPYALLRERGRFRMEVWERAEGPHVIYFFEYAGETIWGATARILLHYLDLMEG